jgi:16S rRNA (adenine1518-N6/adenine1519-N6)-dimethyltransferase
MCQIADVQPNDLVVEIGPGLGTLTEKLLECGAKVVAIEYDKSLIAPLQNKFRDYPSTRFWVEEANILTYNFDSLSENYKIVANIPYYLTSNLIRVLSETSNSPSSVTLLIQKEVAERVCANAGDMSMLSVSAQMYFECSLGPLVPAKLFTPPPKVDSQIVHMQRRQKPLFEDLDSKQLFRVVKAGFSNKRKTLHNSLSAGLQISKDEAKTLLESVPISLNARPQELSLEQWITLTHKYLTR